MLFYFYSQGIYMTYIGKIMHIYQTILTIPNILNNIRMKR